MNVPQYSPTVSRFVEVPILAQTLSRRTGNHVTEAHQVLKQARQL